MASAARGCKRAVHDISFHFWTAVLEAMGQKRGRKADDKDDEGDGVGKLHEALGGITIGDHAEDGRRRREQQNDQREIAHHLDEDEDRACKQAADRQGEDDREQPAKQAGPGQPRAFLDIGGDLAENRPAGLHRKGEIVGGGRDHQQRESAVKRRQRTNRRTEEGDVGGRKGDARDQKRNEGKLAEDRGEQTAASLDDRVGERQPEQHRRQRDDKPESDRVPDGIDQDRIAEDARLPLRNFPAAFTNPEMQRPVREQRPALRRKTEAASTRTGVTVVRRPMATAMAKSGHRQTPRGNRFVRPPLPVTVMKALRPETIRSDIHRNRAETAISNRASTKPRSFWPVSIMPKRRVESVCMRTGRPKRAGAAKLATAPAKVSEAAAISAGVTTGRMIPKKMRGRRAPAIWPASTRSAPTESGLPR